MGERLLTRSRLGVYHQGMGTSPSPMSASLVCLGPKAAGMACFGSTRTFLPLAPPTLRAESAGLSRESLLPSIVLGVGWLLLDASLSSVDASAPLAMLLLLGVELERSALGQRDVG